MEKFLVFFAKRHILTNLILFGILASGIYSWFKIGKEAMPNMAFNFIAINTVYPGATAEDVDVLVTVPIENAIRGVSGIEEVTSTSNNSRSSIRVRFYDNHPNIEESLQEIKDATLRADLPSEAEDPTFRRFKTSERPIIDIGIYIKESRTLNTEMRKKLQAYALSLENRILGLKEISGVSRRGYRKPNLIIKVKPDKLLEYNLSISEIITQVKSNEIRMPGGNLENPEETEISVLIENRTPEDLKKLVIRGSFEGKLLRLGDVADISFGFAKTKEIRKLQGHEGVILNFSKSSSYDILSARAAILDATQKFKKNYSTVPIDIIAMDDESFDTRNRLSLIGINGLIGFILILIILFVFLDFKSGFWVALGIPFTLCFTLVYSYLSGYTVNNITLAAIIIVMGMVVDDAIIVAENIVREKAGGLKTFQAAITGTSSVFLPVVASIATTCAAFVPFLFFSGHFGRFVSFIPIIIFLMLGSSLLESFLILPSHLTLTISDCFKRIFPEKKLSSVKQHWFTKIENYYEIVLLKIMNFRYLVILFFIFLLLLSAYLVTKKMKYVMFPREEVNEFRLMASAPHGTNRFETETLLRQIEDIILEDKGKNVLAVRCGIGIGRRGGEAKENELMCRIELYPKEERDKSTNKLIKSWEKRFEKEVTGFDQIKFAKQRFGHDSGSAIEILIQENDFSTRESIVKEIMSNLKNDPDLTNVEVEKPLISSEYKLDLLQEQMIKLGVSPQKVAESVRAFLEGIIPYKFNLGDEEIDVRITSIESSKDNLESLLELRAENSGRYLVAIKDVVKPRLEKLPNAIKRKDFKKTVEIYADLKEKVKITPLEIAARYENTLFKEIENKYPTASIRFTGEIEDTRESGTDFIFSMILITSLIFGILALLFNSIIKPFIIILILPFGVIGVILAFLAHGMSVFGFFAVVGTLGMMGVVVNDSIVLLHKLERSIDKLSTNLFKNIAGISKTRLRAVLLTTLTTIAGLFPTAYGIAGYDSMLAEMMLAMGWGLIFGTLITLLLVPIVYSIYMDTGKKIATYLGGK